MTQEPRLDAAILHDWVEHRAWVGVAESGVDDGGRDALVDLAPSRRDIHLFRIKAHEKVVDRRVVSEIPDCLPDQLHDSGIPFGTLKQESIPSHIRQVPHLTQIRKRDLHPRPVDLRFGTTTFQEKVEVHAASSS